MKKHLAIIFTIWSISASAQFLGDDLIKPDFYNDRFNYVYNVNPNSKLWTKVFPEDQQELVFSNGAKLVANDTKDHFEQVLVEGDFELRVTFNGWYILNKKSGDRIDKIDKDLFYTTSDDEKRKVSNKSIAYLLTEQMGACDFLPKKVYSNYKSISDLLKVFEAYANCNSSIALFEYNLPKRDSLQGIQFSGSLTDEGQIYAYRSDSTDPLTELSGLGASVGYEYGLLHFLKYDRIQLRTGVYLNYSNLSGSGVALTNNEPDDIEEIYFNLSQNQFEIEFPVKLQIGILAGPKHNFYISGGVSLSMIKLFGEQYNYQLVYPTYVDDFVLTYDDMDSQIKNRFNYLGEFGYKIRMNNNRLIGSFVRMTKAQEVDNKSSLRINIGLEWSI
ncbi:hypothetical protein N9L20_08345 [Flavobacteriaceae bacterium]|nr:hypothetical protein [Flavobacteriaceae bacterium]